jgi:hypothetical protein
MSEKGMQILHKRNLFPDLKQIYLDFCWHCIYGKQKRVSFLKVRKEKKIERLELVHTNIWGPAQLSSLGGSCYHVNFDIFGFIAFDKNMIFLRNGKLWLTMRQEGS